jgi:hypothetical protein
MSISRISAALAAAALSATAANASIITVTPADVGTSYTVNYDGFADGSTIPGLMGQTVFTLTGTTGNSYSFDYTVRNTSTDPITASRISGFGFDTDPNISSATSTGEFSTEASGNVPSGFGRVDVCFKGGGGANNCAGGGSGGVELGDSASGSLTLNFTEMLDQLALSNFFVRYQSIDGAGAPDSAIGRGTPVSSSGGSTGGGSTGGSTGGTPVPAPAALGLFVPAVGALMLRRRRKAAA